ncbi:hypothetical protein BS329_40360 [Amycolatopsis coloradensis]|uniref:Uncharacterized protein n=1 Tax=Amycolatopsis coloradensis TaxID=76021 RepID=A0A1R0KDH0_9PSEU|nr:hypothetical protein [Amycolatopsis coloradensis]OLZ42998.1 hypothetical protein BS329_40360 [Amycolatopsis coloradensis]
MPGPPRREIRDARAAIVPECGDQRVVRRGQRLVLGEGLRWPQRFLPLAGILPAMAGPLNAVQQGGGRLGIAVLGTVYLHGHSPVRAFPLAVAQDPVRLGGLEWRSGVASVRTRSTPQQHQSPHQ